MMCCGYKAGRLGGFLETVSQISSCKIKCQFLSSLLLAPIDVAVFLSSLPLLCTRFSLWPLKIQYGIFHECTSIGCICLMGREGCTHNTHIIHTHNGMTLTQLIDFRVGGEGLKIGPLSGPTRLNYRHKAVIQGFWIPPSN